jgi:hypothetical protein
MPKPYQHFGTYKIAGEYIYFSGHIPDHVYILFQTNGECPDQEIMVPEYAVDALTFGILWRSTALNPSAAVSQKAYNEALYKTQVHELDCFLQPVNIEELLANEGRLPKWGNAGTGLWPHHELRTILGTSTPNNSQVPPNSGGGTPAPPTPPTPPTETFKYYFGSTDTNVITTEGQILSLVPGIGVKGANTAVDYRSFSQPGYLVYAEPLLEPMKTVVYINGENYGAIGPDNLFTSWVTIGSFRVTISLYKTQQNDGLVEFRKS